MLRWSVLNAAAAVLSSARGPSEEESDPDRHLAGRTTAAATSTTTRDPTPPPPPPTSCRRRRPRQQLVRPTMKQQHPTAARRPRLPNANAIIIVADALPRKAMDNEDEEEEMGRKNTALHSSLSSSVSSSISLSGHTLPTQQSGSVGGGCIGIGGVGVDGGGKTRGACLPTHSQPPEHSAEPSSPSQSSGRGKASNRSMAQSHSDGSQSSSDNCGNGDQSMTNACWEAAEGGNSHELAMDEIDDARRRVKSLFPKVNDDNDDDKDLVHGDAVPLVVIPQFDLKELSLGKFLGRGGFSNVHEVRRICLQRGDDEEEGAEEGAGASSSMSAEARHFLAEHCTRDTGEARYAIKQVRLPSLGMSSADTTKKKEEDGDVGGAEDNEQHERRRRGLVGMVDLATEAEFLKRLEHPHLVKLRGTAACDPFSPGYFLIVDRLCETLYARLQDWKEQNRKLRWSGTSSSVMKNRLVHALKRRCSFGGGGGRGSGSLASASQYSTAKTRPLDRHHALWCARLSAACDLVSAIEYLHEKRIIHRDIKPTNVGFDIRGDLKIFDFGMARVLDPRDAQEDGTYTNLSHMTGSLRYMAPEVALGLPYHTSCDVYSLSLVVWEMLALKRPYQPKPSSSFGSRNQHKYKDEAAFHRTVFEGKTRPPLPSQWPSGIRIALSGGWAHTVQDRHNVHQLSAALMSEWIYTTTTGGCHRGSRSADGDRPEGGRPPARQVDNNSPPVKWRPDDDCRHRRRRSTHVFQPSSSSTAAVPQPEAFLRPPEDDCDEGRL